MVTGLDPFVNHQQRCVAGPVEFDSLEPLVNPVDRVLHVLSNIWQSSVAGMPSGDNCNSPVQSASCIDVERPQNEPVSRLTKDGFVAGL